MKHLLSKLTTLFCAAIVGVMASTCVFGANVVIENGDGPNTGFNDTTPVSPVGGNSGTTVGQQRLIALQYAASIWGARLSSGPTITIRATWESLTCTASSAALASAGNSGGIFRDFPGAIPNTWYGNALANAISNTDRNGTTHEINARFNLNIGNPGCLESAHWYYGLDTNHGSGGVNLVSVAMHELAHGLGFQTFTNSSSGSQSFGVPSIYDRFLMDNSTGKHWPDMTDSERAASATNTTHLVWDGPKVKADAPAVLKTPLLKVNTPPAVAGNYEIGTADFGASLSSPGVTANVVQANDPADATGPTSTDGCSPLTNAAEVSGKIALIDRGICTFVSKVKNAQNAGAVGVIIVNNVSGAPPGMGGSDSTITIPIVSITNVNGDSIKAQLASGVNASLLLDGSTPAGADSAGRLRMFSPNPVEGGSSVSHWDTTAFPNQLMEPNISGDLTHNVTPPSDLTTSLFSDLGWSTLEASPTPTPTPTPAPFFSSATYSVSEDNGNAQIMVNRSDTTAAVTVRYSTSDTAGLAGCTVFNGKGSERCDYVTSVGTLQFAAGEASKSFTIPIIDDVHVEGNETFTITLSNASGASIGTPSTATVTIIDNDTVTTTQNPIDGVDFFIRQQYLDFLNRQPDAGGFQNWIDTLGPCPNGGFGEPPTSNCDRLHVAAGFFQSEEFLNRGYFAFRFYMVSYGLRPTYAQFIPDMAQVGGPKSPAEEEASKVAFSDAFVQRPEFLTKYGSLSGQPLANALLVTAGLPSNTFTVSGNMTNGQILRGIAETTAALNKFLIEGTVSVQYFGFLRRDPDAIGYQNNLDTLNANPNNLRHMIFIFIYSTEYRSRFGP